MLHLAAFAAATPLGVLLIVHARPGSARVGAIVFAASVTAMLGVGSLFHRRYWPPSRMRWITLLDHATIYALIAGTYTPLALVAVHPSWRGPTLVFIWGAAAVGTVAKFTRPHAPPWVAAGTCLAMGWASLVVMPQIVGGIGVAATSLLLAGGLAYSVGAVVYARKRPDPFPRTFGYHELFHAFVLVALGLQYATVAFFVLPSA